MTNGKWKNVPPYFVLLAIVHKTGGITPHELLSLIKRASCASKFYDGLTELKELLEDLNVLRVLNLVTVRNGKYYVTERGLQVLSKVSSADPCLGEIMGPGSARDSRQ